MIIKKETPDSIDLVVEKLLNREVVIIPTDTVYGFSAIVDPNFDNSKKIRTIKGREENKPFIQLIASPKDIYKYTKDLIPESLFNKWPGALTIIVNDCYGGTIGFRCPGDIWLRKIIEKVNFPLYSTSVNKSGTPILENIGDIKSVFEKEVSLIVDDGNKRNAMASTIVKIEKNEYIILRQGSVLVN